jgi:hypothetical protein
MGIASALWGGGWVWPHGTDTIGHVIGGLLGGRPGRGFPPSQAHRVAGQIAIYACVVLCEVVVASLSIALAVLVARYRRPGDVRRGMATRSDAKEVLGVGRLRAAKEIIRPDLHARATRDAER